MQCYSKRVTLTTQRSGECVITSCRCVCCFSLSGVWSCCRSFSSSCICHSLSWTVCFSISWSNAVSSRCTGSWGSLNTHTHTRSVITISAGLRHLLSLGHVFFLTYLHLTSSHITIKTLFSIYLYLFFFYIDSSHSFTCASFISSHLYTAHKPIHPYFFLMLRLRFFSIWLRLLWVSDLIRLLRLFCSLLRFHTCKYIQAKKT